MKYMKLVFLFTTFLLFSHSLYASNGITYHGRIVKPDDTPLESATTRFRIQIKAPDAGNCVLWEEEQTRNMLGSNGTFTITIGDSSNTSVNYLRVDSYGWGMERVFSNKTAFTPLSGCAVGTAYIPNAADGRIIEVSFKEAPTDPTWEAFPATKINFIPMAFNTLQLEGSRADEFLKINPYAGQTPITNAGVNTLLGLIAGTSTVYSKPSDPLGGDLSGTVAAGTVVGIRGRGISATAPVTGQILKFNGVSSTWEPAADDTGGATGDASYSAKGVVQFLTNQATSGLQVTSGVVSLPNTITAAGPTGSASVVPVITYDAKGRLTTVTTATVNDTTKLPLAGGTMTGPINMGTQAVTNAASVSANDFSGRNFYHYNLANSRYANIKAPDALGVNYTLTLPAAAPTNGSVLSTDGSGNLSWVAAATGSVTSVTGTAPILSSGGTTPVISLDTGLGASKIPQVGGTALGANGVVVANGLGTALTSLKCTLGQVIKFNASGFATCGADSGASGTEFVQNGNTFAAAATLGTNDNFALNFETNNVTAMTILPSGNVGIGTTTPDKKLTIYNGTVNHRTGLDDGGLYFTNLAGAYNNSITTNGNSTMYVTGESSLVLQTSGTDRLKVDYLGNVGVGTSSPNTTSILDLTSTTKGFLLPRMTTAQRNAIASPANGLQVYDTDLAAIYLYNGSSWAAVGGGGGGAASSVLASAGSAATPSISFSGDTNTGFYNGGADVISASVGGTNALSLDPTWLSVNTSLGIIGMGSTLALSSNLGPNAGTDVTISDSYSSRNVTSGIANLLGVGIYFGPSSGTGEFNAINVNPTVNQTGGANGISRGVYVNPTLTSAADFRALEVANGKSVFMGNVGIGTTTPGSKLQVASTHTATSGQTYGMQITPTYNQSSSSANNTDLLINRTETAVGSGYQRLIEAQVGGVTRFSVDSLGQTISESSYNLTNGGNFSAQFASDGAVAALSALGSRDMIFRTTNTYTERMRITTGGNVGIGTTTPTSLLTLKGAGSGAQGLETYGLVNHMYNSTTPVPLSIYAADVLDVASTTGSTNRIFRWGPQYINSSSISGVLGYNGGASTVNIGSENADLSFSANGWASEHMRISSAGNVGVGTGAPRGKLDVTGAILGAASTVNATTTINFSAGNIQHTNSNCQAFALNNLKDGASYLFIVKGTTVATCSFTAFSDAGTTALTVHLPPGHTATTAGKHTLYSMAVSGGDVYFSWVPGY